METHVETLIVSDVHLGSEVSRAEDLLEMLRTHTFNHLILLGVYSALQVGNFPRGK